MQIFQYTYAFSISMTIPLAQKGYLGRGCLIFSDFRYSSFSSSTYCSIIYGIIYIEETISPIRKPHTWYHRYKWYVRMVPNHK